MEGQHLTHRVIDPTAVEQFIYREARLADEHRYDEWESLWAEQAVYWVPIDEAGDPESRISYIFDNRARLASRIRQLKTGRRHSQAPPSRLRRVISNIEIEQQGDEVVVTSNFVLVESRREILTTWAGQTEHRLQGAPGEFRIASKIVRLINSGEAIPNLAFLI
jgi:3-phenylpropionate/cinnamic acid dioxygenase small subunit